MVKLFFGLITPILIYTSFASRPMMMKTPYDANGLSAIGIFAADCVSKEHLSKLWLSNKFRIENDEIAEEILASQIRWSGPCACPYNLNLAGNRCGGTSHYSKSNNLDIKCYPKDVMDSKKSLSSP